MLPVDLRSPRRSLPSRRAFRRQGGVALVLTVIAVGVAMILSLSFLGSQSTLLAISENVRAHPRARHIAESGLESAIQYVRSDDEWRSARSEGTWVEGHGFAGGDFTIVAEDGMDANGDGVIDGTEGDGDLGDNPADSLTLTAIGRCEGASHTVRAVVSFSGPADRLSLEDELDMTDGRIDSFDSSEGPYGSDGGEDDGDDDDDNGSAWWKDNDHPWRGGPPGWGHDPDDEEDEEDGDDGGTGKGHDNGQGEGHDNDKGEGHRKHGDGDGDEDDNENGNAGGQGNADGNEGGGNGGSASVGDGALVGVDTESPGAVRLTGGSRIFGDLHYGSEGDDDVVQTGPTSEITGSTGPMSGPLQLPDPMGWPRNVGPGVGDRHFAGFHLISANKRYGTVTIKHQAQVYINGEVTLRVDGDLILRDDSALELLAGASLELYVGGRIRVQGGSRMNVYSGDASRMILYGRGSGVEHEIRDDSEVYAILDAPEASLQIRNGARLYGAVLARSAALKQNNASLHLDRSPALPEANPRLRSGTGLSVSWVEAPGGAGVSGRGGGSE